jgi:hypothetical protein
MVTTRPRIIGRDNTSDGSAVRPWRIERYPLAMSGKHPIGLAECDARFDRGCKVAMPVCDLSIETPRAQHDVGIWSSAVPVSLCAATLDSNPVAGTRRFRQAPAGFVGVDGLNCSH